MVKKCNVVCDGEKAHFIAFVKHNRSPNAKIEFKNERANRV